MYCENCFQEDLDYWEELYDGTIVCSEKCAREWYKDVLQREPPEDEWFMIDQDDYHKTMDATLEDE